MYSRPKPKTVRKRAEIRQIRRKSNGKHGTPRWLKRQLEGK